MLSDRFLTYRKGLSMRPNKETIKLMHEFEGCRLNAYLCPAGVWTIGWGHAATSGIGPIPRHGMTITQERADQIFADDLAVFGKKVLTMFKHKPSPNVFGACLSLAYNIGMGAFRKSTCLRRLNAGDVKGAAEALQWFNKAGGKTMRGLVRRRTAEAELMLKDEVVYVPDDQETRLTPDGEKAAVKSTTLAATGVTAVSGATGVATAVGQLEGNSQLLVIGFAALAVLALAWIARERIKKLAQGV
jgi:GH24 family phage-related lysozyme (muramidase)